MTNDTTTQNSIKIKMDTYTKQLYEDFIHNLSEKLRDVARDTANRLEQINESLDALPAQVKEPEEMQLKKIDELLNQLNSIIREHDNKMLSNIIQTINTQKSNLQTSINSSNEEIVKYFDTLNALIGDLANEVNITPDVINSSVNLNIASMNDRLNNDLGITIKDNSDSVTNRVNEHTHHEMGLLADSFVSKIQSVLSVIKDLQDDLHSDHADKSDRLDERISKALSIALVQMRRNRFNEHLIYKTLKAFIESTYKYRVNSDEQISSIVSYSLEQKANSSQSLDLNTLINSEISRLSTYIVSEDHSSINELVKSSISKVRDQIEDSINRAIKVLENYYPDLKEFLAQQNKDITLRIIDNMAERSNTYRDEILQAISTNKINGIEKINAVCTDIINNVDALKSELSGHLSELVKTLLNQHDELMAMYHDLSEKNNELMAMHHDLSERNDELTEQVNINQELLIWILTPWYKKILRRKNGKPQILAKKPISEPEVD